MKDKQRIEVTQAVTGGRVTVEQAMLLVERSRRTVFRWQALLREQGLSGLVHGNRGRPSAMRTPEEVRRRVVELARTKYADVNDTHLRELLAEREGIELGRETLRGILRAAGCKPKRRRRPGEYRCRRERKAAAGMMLQVDASEHDWLEGRGPRLTLVGAIDDATGRVWAHFVASETTWAYLELMQGVVRSAGVPLSLYSDRHSIFFVQREPTVLEQLHGVGPLTQFGRAMDELGTRLIPAYSPQAKGRIERLWGTLQDRLVVELRLAGATTLDEANVVLRGFVAAFNKRFAVEPRQAQSVFRKAPCAAELRRILCLKQTRTVSKDHTVSFEGLTLQIPPSSAFRSIARRPVEVLQLPDGSVDIELRRRTVAHFSAEAIARMVRQRPHLKSDLRAA